ncbi:MAG: SBBP repeat-containing protein [Planctomycetia bacterium]|nr:SBBP repeat-containing protein [Planctomycetia bacterium]
MFCRTMVSSLFATAMLGSIALLLTGPSVSGSMTTPEQPYEVAWSRQIGTSSSDDSHSVAVDGDHNVYIAGWTGGSLGGPSVGNHDAFVTKFDSSGNLLWCNQIGTPDYDYGSAVAVDGDGNAYISGRTTGSLGGPNAGDYDAFLEKYDSSGNLSWSSQIGTAKYDAAYGVAVDRTGNAYVSVTTGGSLTEPNAGSFDVYLVKYDSSGHLGRAKK